MAAFPDEVGDIGESTDFRSGHGVRMREAMSGLRRFRARLYHCLQAPDIPGLSWNYAARRLAINVAECNSVAAIS